MSRGKIIPDLHLKNPPVAYRVTMELIWAIRYYRNCLHNAHDEADRQSLKDMELLLVRRLRRYDEEGVVMAAKDEI